MEDTSQVGRDMRDVVVDGVTLVFVGIDVGLSREREHVSYRQIFVYKTNDEVESMSLEDARDYDAKKFHDGWFDILSHERENIGDFYFYI